MIMLEHRCGGCRVGRREAAAVGLRGHGECAEFVAGRDQAVFVEAAVESRFGVGQCAPAVPRSTRIEVVTRIGASPEVCFDCARSLDLHVRSLAHTGERAVAGRTSGLIELGEEVTWRARHFGFVHHHTARITQFTRPTHFRDEMVRGRFLLFEHDHWFTPVAGGTEMRDALNFASPCGWLGRLVDRWLLRRYLTRLLQARNQVVRGEAEAMALGARRR